MFHKILHLYKKKKILKKFLDYGTNFEIDFNSVFVEPERMSFGDNVFINRNAFLSGSIKINNNIMIGPYLTAFSDNHTFGKVGKSIMSYSKEYNSGKIIIQDDCWLGANVSIFGDVTIGIGPIIGGGAIITKDIPPFSLVIGSNKIIKQIFNKDEAIEHLKLLEYKQVTVDEILKKMNH